jgi:hypothetical protein
MRNYRQLTAGLGLALLLTTAASSAYADSTVLQVDSQQVDLQQSSLFCKLLPSLSWCNKGGGKVPPSPAATPELGSLLLFGVGLSGLGGFALSRYRARRRS